MEDDSSEDGVGAGAPVPVNQSDSCWVLEADVLCDDRELAMTFVGGFRDRKNGVLENLAPLSENLVVVGGAKSG